MSEPIGAEFEDLEDIEEFFVFLHTIRKAFDPSHRSSAEGQLDLASKNEFELQVRTAFAYFQKFANPGHTVLEDPRLFQYAFESLLTAPAEFGTQRKAYWPIVGIVGSRVVQLSKSRDARHRLLDAVQHRFDRERSLAERINLLQVFEGLCQATTDPHKKLWDMANHFAARVDEENDLVDDPNARLTLEYLCKCGYALAVKVKNADVSVERIRTDTLSLLQKTLQLIERGRRPYRKAIGNWVMALLSLELPRANADRSPKEHERLEQIARLLAKMRDSGTPLGERIKYGVQPQVMHYVHGRSKRENRRPIPEKHARATCLFRDSGSSREWSMSVILEDVCAGARGFRLYAEELHVYTVQVNDSVAMCRPIEGVIGNQSVVVDAAVLTVPESGLGPFQCGILRAWPPPDQRYHSGVILYADDKVSEMPGWSHWQRDVVSQFDDLKDFVDAGAASGISAVELIATGEGERVEFKSSVRYSYKKGAVDKELELMIVKSVAAFANKRGGNLLIGVDDQGVVIGLEHDYESMGGSKDSFERRLRELIANGVVDHGTEFCANNVSVEIQRVHEKDVCVVAVKAADRPVFVNIDKGQRLQKFYVRDGNASRELPPSESTEYCKRRFR